MQESKPAIGDAEATAGKTEDKGVWVMRLGGRPTKISGLMFRDMHEYVPTPDEVSKAIADAEQMASNMRTRGTID